MGKCSGKRKYTEHTPTRMTPANVILTKKLGNAGSAEWTMQQWWVFVFDIEVCCTGFLRGNQLLQHGDSGASILLLCQGFQEG